MRSKGGTMMNNQWNNGNNVWDNRTVGGTMDNNENKCSPNKNLYDYILNTTFLSEFLYVSKPNFVFYRNFETKLCFLQNFRDQTLFFTKFSRPNFVFSKIFRTKLYM